MKAHGTLTLTVDQAKVVTDILMRVIVKGIPNIHKSRLQQLIGAQLSDFEKARLELLQEHGELDENGKLVVVGEQYKIKDAAAFNAAFMELKKNLLVQVSTEDPVKEKAVTTGLKLLIGEECPTLNVEESLMLVGIVDAFEAAKAIDVVVEK